MATPKIVPRADGEGGIGSTSKYWGSAYIDTITTTGDITASGNVSIAEKLIHTGDTDTFLQFGDNDIKLKAGGATYFHAVADQTTILYSGNSPALSLDTSQNATFAGKILAGSGATAAATINAYTTTVSTNLFSALRIIENSAASSYWDIGATGGGSPDLKFFVNASTTPKLTLSTAGAVTATTYNGIPFFTDTGNQSMYTHDVSSTDDGAAQNTAYGFQALESITTGDNNTVIGFQAGEEITTGVNNTLIGTLAGDALTTGGYNVALGYGALSAEDAHNFNVAIGGYSLYSQNAGANAIKIIK